MDPSITSSFFQANRNRLFQSLSANVLIISASGLLQKTIDQAMPFRQDSNFWYLTGLNEPDLLLVKTRHEEFIIIPDIYIRRQSILGAIDNSEISKISGIKQVVSEKEGWQKLDKALGSNGKLATLLANPVILKHHGIYTNPTRRYLLSRLKRRYPRVKIVDVRKQLAGQRMVKQDVEVKIIKKAIDITTDTLSEVLAPGRLSSYKDTSEIEEAILAGFLSRGGSGHGFEPIVATGVDASFIHFDKLGVALKPNQLLLCDVGSEYSFYCADITRTVSIGQPTTRQQAVFDAVKHVQSEAYKQIMPGINIREYEHQIERLIGEQLKSLRLISSLNHKDIRKYYPHACSHSLGLDAHDMADYSQGLPENMVMTVEPGIYIREERIGVRLEDVVRITKDGCEVLSSDLATSLKL